MFQPSSVCGSPFPPCTTLSYGKPLGLIRQPHQSRTQQTYSLLLLAMAQTLSDLPSEIRMEIYSYLLITDTGINPFIRRSPGYVCGMGPLLQCITMLTNMARTLHLHPAILRICKAIYEEAASILTQRNIFICQSYDSATYDLILPHSPDRSWDSVKNQYHCAPTYAPTGPITSRSHGIQHLEVRLDGQDDYKIAMAMLTDVLAPHNMLKTFNLEIWDVWDPDRLHNVRTKLAGATNRIAINIQVVQRLWRWESHRGPGPDRLEKSIMEWNQTSNRQYVKTNFELTTEQRGREPWARLWKRDCYWARRWALSPCVAQA